MLLQLLMAPTGCLIALRQQAALTAGAGFADDSPFGLSLTLLPGQLQARRAPLLIKVRSSHARPAALPAWHAAALCGCVQASQALLQGQENSPVPQT